MSIRSRNWAYTDLQSVLFYGPLAYAHASWKDDEKKTDLEFEEDHRTEYTDALEKTPLLQSQK
jgi:hypothetical protein